MSDLSLDAHRVIRAMATLQMELISVKEKRFYNGKINKYCNRFVVIFIDTYDNYLYYSYWKTIKPHIMPVIELDFEPNTDEDFIDVNKRYFIEMNCLVEELFKYSDERYYEMMDMLYSTDTDDAKLLIQHIKNRI